MLGELLVSSFYQSGITAAQTECKVSTYGTEFVFGFLDLPYYDSNNQASNPDLSVIVTSTVGTYVHVTTFSTGSASKTPTPETQKYYVYQFKQLNFNSSFINKYQDTSSGGIIKIRSDDPIAVMTVYDFETSSHKKVVPILPTNTLSTSYAIPSYRWNTYSFTQFLVISLNDSTEVRFEGYETGNMVHQLTKEEIYMYQRQVDLSSTSASSNHPVAIFSSVTAGNNPRYGSQYGAYLSMQVPPIERYATHFIVPPIDEISVKYYRVRIYASVQNAFVKIHSTSDSMQAVHVYYKIFHELTTDSSTVLEIVSDSPLAVVQIALETSDKPLFMTNIPAVSQFLDSYTTTGLSGKHVSPSSKFIITIPFSEASGLLINRKPIAHDPTKFTQQTPLGNFTVLILKTSSSVSTISHVNSVPFALLVVGEWDSRIYNSNYHYAYGFQAGMQFTTDCPAGSPQTDSSGPLVG